MRTFLLLFVLLISVNVLGQEAVPVEELDKSFSAIKTFFLPAVMAALVALFADAKKWMMSGNWSWKVFLSTKLAPFIYAVLGGVILYLLLAYFPFTKPFIEVWAGSELAEVTAAGLMGFATAIIDGILKTTKTDVEEQS